HLDRDLRPRAVLEPVLAVAGVARAADENLMEQLTRAPFWKRDRTLLAIVGLLLIAGTGVFAWSDRMHDWRWYQPEFRRRVAEKLGADKAATVPSGLQQIWVPDLHRADRCTTC